jgi:hypothetical protein
MSLPALMEATCKAIRAKFDLTELGCDVTPDAQPHPSCGEWFYAVHPGSVSNVSPRADVHVQEEYSFSVTVTRRTGVPPHDRLGPNAMLEKDGILGTARKMALEVVNMNYDLMGEANDLIGAENGFTKPPVYLGMNWLGPRGPSWFFAEGDDGDVASGLAVEVNFGRAVRTQYLEEAT